MRPHDYHLITHLIPSFRRYIDDKVETGSFLRACLENDLLKACNRADETNMWLLPIICCWLYNEAPAPCWGSAEKVEDWLATRRAQKCRICEVNDAGGFFDSTVCGPCYNKMER